MLNTFLDGCYTFDKLEITGEQSQWHGHLFKSSSEFPVPDIVGLSYFFTVVMPIVKYILSDSSQLV